MHRLRFDNERYEEIKQQAATLFHDVGIDTIPIDPWEMTRSMGVLLVEYSSLPEPERAFVQEHDPDGLAFQIPSGNGSIRRYIGYNDYIGRGRQRFTLLHEIGHIALGHKQPSELAEAEANFFAKFAIAPPVLVDLIKPSDYMDIALAFDTSAECAYHCMSYYQKWLEYAPKNVGYERMLLKQFTCSGEGGDAMLRTKKGA